MKKLIPLVIALCLLFPSSLAMADFNSKSEVFQLDLYYGAKYYPKYSNNASWIRASEVDLACLAASIFLDVAVNDMSANVVVSDQFPSVLIIYDLANLLQFRYLGVDGLYSTSVILDEKSKSISFFSFSKSRENYELALSSLKTLTMNLSSKNVRQISGKEFEIAFKSVSQRKQK